MTWPAVILFLGISLIVFWILALVVFKQLAIKFWRREVENIREADERMKQKHKEFKDEWRKWGNRK